MEMRKLSPQIQLALRYLNILPYDAFLGIMGQPVGDQFWDVLVIYRGNLQPIANQFNLVFQIVSNNFAITRVNRDVITLLTSYAEISYIEFPEVMMYIQDTPLVAICATEAGLTPGNYTLTGRGVLIAVIDSGINYMHEDFCNVDNTTRIAYLWDQNIEGNPPEGFLEGTQYTREQINEALNANTVEEQLAIVPSVDTLGHGTALAGVAGGNGRRSNGQFRGVATESEFLIVKLKENPQIPSPARGPRNIDVMLGVRYAVERARELGRPLSIVIGLGINEGSHDGQGSLEAFLNQINFEYVVNICVGTGNEANKDSHTRGIIQQGQREFIQIIIEPGQPYYFCTLWKSFMDEFSLVVRAPSGEVTEVLTEIVNNRAFILNNTIVMVNFSEPTDITKSQQIIVFLERFDTAAINSGVWTLEMTGLEILQGNYNIWGSNVDPNLILSRFVNPDPFITLTIPSTADGVTSVAAYNNITNQIASFSGRGFTRIDGIKPDFVAPGVNIVAPDIASITGYAPITGTSVASAFACGAYAVLMEYGILRNGDNDLHGERLKAFVLKNTRKPIQYRPYPNTQWGYGILCVANTISELQARYQR
jgi:subtilisin family serine protease